MWAATEGAGGRILEEMAQPSSATALVIASLAFGACGGGGSPPGTAAASSRPTHFPVPKVIGERPHSARKGLVARGLDVKFTVLSNLCADVPPNGRIIAQRPRAGTGIDRGQTVFLLAEPINGNPASLHVHRPLGPGATLTGLWRWLNWCGSGHRFLLTAELGGARAPGRAPTPICQTEDRPSNLTFVRQPAPTT
jgi:hypothetical protein